MNEEFWSLATEMIGTDTSKAAGNAGLQRFMERLATTSNLRLRLFAAEHDGRPQFNYLLSAGPVGKGGLLLVTHTDTVPAGPLDRWTETPPFTLKRDQGKVFGLGVADVKLDFLCKLFALRGVDPVLLNKPVHLLGTFSEEVGLIGAKRFAEQQLAELSPDWVLCGEPSELIPCPAHKGYAVVRVTATSEEAISGQFVTQSFAGKAAHSSTPHLGVNAIEVMLATLLSEHARYPVLAANGGTSPNTVPSLATAMCATKADGTAASGFDLRLSLHRLQHAWRTWCQMSAALTPATADDFSPSTVVNNWGQISSEGGKVSAVFDARLLPEHDPYALLTPFVAQAASSELHVEVLRDNAGMRARPDSKLLHALSGILEGLGRSGAWKPKATSTEAGVFARAGYDAAVFGPGVSVGNAHTANEWNRETDLDVASDVYRRLISTLCSTG